MKPKTLTLLILTAIVMASVACSNRPTQVEPTLNIDALVEANKVIDALVEAKVKEVVAALPTSTPYPTYTSVPMPSPIPTPTVIMPTPTLPPTVTPIPRPTPTRTLVPPPTITPLPTVISEGTLPVFPWTITTPEPNGSSSNRNTGPNIDEKWINDFESLLHEALNRERRKHDLPDVEYDLALSDIARLHSQDMAKLDYFEHSNTKGESSHDRAKKAGYNCQSKRIGDWVYTGLGQNIQKISIWESSRLEDGERIYNYYSQRELVSLLVSDEAAGWMADGSDTIILKEHYRTNGIGVSVTDDVPKSMYVTINLSACDFRWRSQK